MYAIRLIIDINMSLSNLIFIIGASAVPKVDLIFALISRINDRIKALKEKEDREPKREREIESSRSCVNDRYKEEKSGGHSVHRAGANKLHSRVKGPREGPLLELLSPARSDRYLLSRLVVVVRMTKTRAALCQEPAVGPLL